MEELLGLVTRVFRDFVDGKADSTKLMVATDAYRQIAEANGAGPNLGVIVCPCSDDDLDDLEDDGDLDDIEDGGDDEVASTDGDTGDDDDSEDAGEAGSEPKVISPDFKPATFADSIGQHEDVIMAEMSVEDDAQDGEDLEPQDEAEAVSDDIDPTSEGAFDEGDDDDLI